MFSCKVLVGPIATDKEYHTGDTVCLDKKDADTLSGFGLVEIIGEVEPKFVAQVLPTAEAGEAAPTIDLFPVADEIPVIVEASASAEATLTIEPTPVVAPVIEAEVTPVIESAPVIETSVEVVVPVGETTLDGEEAIGLEEVATGSKRKK